MKALPPVWAIIVLLPASLITTIRAQDSAPAATPVNKEQIETALKLTREAAERYDITLDDAGPTAATLLPDPILRWSNPAAGEVHGNVFLWTVNNRPTAVASIFKWFSPHTHMSHEFHSLASVPLRAKYSGRETWTTSAPGVTFSPLVGAPRPAPSAPQRLLQMRQFARSFSATKKERDNNTSELRLLPQPIYRYSSTDARVLDGSLFVFVQGTDPEVFVLLEALGPVENERWSFAAARMNSVALTLRYEDKTVWSVPVMAWSDVSSHREIYTTVRQEQIQNP